MNYRSEINSVTCCKQDGLTNFISFEKTADMVQYEHKTHNNEIFP